VQVTSDSHLSFRRAAPADIGAIVALVNSAYRGESSRAGWTTEADLLDGQRTDAAEIAHLIGVDDSLILLCLRGDEIIGSAHLEMVDTKAAYLGMLVIKPVLQGQSLGKLLIREAEDVARAQWGTTRMQIQVITLRHELIAYYERLGYRRTGEIRPFPTDPRYGVPKLAGLQFEVLEKV
jgi:ribosomal protein S18 acetylase RimI-like enzyme